MDAQSEMMQAYEAFADAIFRHCYYRVYDREWAKDLMQQTFMRTWEYVADGHPVKNLRAFLYKVANNLVIDELRKKRERLSLEVLQEQGIEPSVDHRPSLESAVEVGLIGPYLRRLDPADQEVLILRYIDDLSPKEIAAMLKETPNIISVRIHRAIKKLRQILPPSYYV